MTTIDQKLELAPKLPLAATFARVRNLRAGQYTPVRIASIIGRSQSMVCHLSTILDSHPMVRELCVEKVITLDAGYLLARRLKEYPELNVLAVIAEAKVIRAKAFTRRKRMVNQSDIANAVDKLLATMTDPAPTPTPTPDPITVTQHLDVATYQARHILPYLDRRVSVCGTLQALHAHQVAGF